MNDNYFMQANGAEQERMLREREFQARDAGHPGFAPPFGRYSHTPQPPRTSYAPYPRSEQASPLDAQQRDSLRGFTQPNRDREDPWAAREREEQMRRERDQQEIQRRREEEIRLQQQQQHRPYPYLDHRR